MSRIRASECASLLRDGDSGRGNQVTFVTPGHWTKVQRTRGMSCGGRACPPVQDLQREFPKPLARQR